MSIETKCTKCGKRIRVKDDFAGKTGKCSSCGELIRIADSIVPPPIISPLAVQNSPSLRFNSCPHCDRPVNSYQVDSDAKCPHCTQPLYIARSGPSAAKTATSEPSPLIVTDGQRRSSESSRMHQSAGIDALQPWRDRSSRGSKFVQFIDLKFNRYLTPFIVRAYWACALVITTLYLVIVILQFFASFAETKMNHVDMPIGTRAHSSGEMDLPRWEWSEDGVEIATRFAWVGIEIIAMIVALLTIRVFCELVILGFNIASTLKSIDDKTGRA